MLELIPAIDLKDGRCVRLVQGAMDQETVYFEDPLEAARLWASQGAPRLHLVDLNGAVSGNPQNFSTVKRLVENLSIPVQLGGGIRERKVIERYLQLGVDRVILGTLACQDPEQVGSLAREFPRRLVLGLDARGGFVAVKGWLDLTRLQAADLLVSFAGHPLCAVIYTDIQRDGMMSGPNLGALEDLLSKSPFPVIASGGIATLGDVRALAHLEAKGLCGAIIGKALYAGNLDYREACKAILGPV